MADDAGALLVRSGLVTEQALGLARAKVESEGGTIGEHLVDAGAIADEALTEFYRTRLLVPQVNPNTLARLPQNVIATIPMELAIELRVVPVSVGDGVTIAMSDPSSRVAVDEVSRVVGTYVVRSIATQMQLAWCLAHYYGFLTPLGVRLLQPGAAEELRQSAPAHVPRRSRGETSKVNASRHHALVPGAEPAQARPDASLLDKLPTVTPLQPAPAAAKAAKAAKAEEQRARTITGEIALRSTSLERVAAISEGPDSGPTVTIEVSPDLRLTRRAPHWVDPPELASRAGELAPRPSAQRAVAAEPAVVIADEALASDRATTHDDLDAQDDESDYASVEIEASASSSGLRSAAVATPADDAESGPILLTSRRPTIDLRRRAPTSKEPEPAAPAAVEHEEPSGVVLLAQPKSSRQVTAVPEPEPPQAPTVATPARKPTSERSKRRADKRTQIGLGIEPSKLELPPVGRAARDTEVSATPPVMAAVTTAAAPPEPAKPTTAAATAKPTAAAAATAAKPATTKEPAPAAATTAAKPVTAATTKEPATAAATAKPATAKEPAAAAKPVTAATTAKPATAAATAKPATAKEPAAAAKPVTAATTKEPAAAAAATTKEPAAAAVTKPATTAPAPATEERPDKRASQRSLPVSDSVDDGWGPPGSTIPPPWLGAIPGGLDATAIPGAIIPLSEESGPLLMAAPSPPQPGAWRSSPSIPIANSPTDLVAELEAATSRVVELVRRLDQARTRDEIIELLIFHLLDSHARAGFFTVRHKVVTAFRIEPAGPESRPEMKLDGASTMQDVVDTGLPYRGQLADEASRQFVTAALGDAPGEILLVPVSVRDRPVGILFADRRKRHTFDEQLAVACRAAGVAFERVLLARRER